MSEIQWTHRLPRGRVVDRLAFLTDAVAGKTVIHVGFADADCRDVQEGLGRWLHAYLDRKAARLVGIDLQPEAVERARAEGYEAYVADCSDPQVLERLGVPRAEVVVAGEVIEHLDAPGPFLDGMHNLVAPGGTLIVTTPNAYSLLNPVAALRRYEVINPDHVSLYSWFTLSNLLSRHGWRVSDFLTYLLPPIRPRDGRPPGRKVDVALAKGLLAFQRAAARRRAAFIADGLIAVCEEADRA